jgi:hypothetical protein
MAKSLYVLICGGSAACEEYEKIKEWYRYVGCEKPENLLEIAIDRHPMVNTLDLPPQNKIFLTSPYHQSGAMLTPRSTIEVFDDNIEKFEKIKNLIEETYRKIRADEIRIVCLLTYVGGTGFTTSIRLGLMLKKELSSMCPVSVFFFGTAPWLSILKFFSSIPDQTTDALKLRNTLFALRYLVAVAPKIDLAFIRFPKEDSPEYRIPYILRSLGLLPTNNFAQNNPFQLEQLMYISHEKLYPLVLQTSILIRIPKKQLHTLEQAEDKLPEFRKDYEELQSKLNEIQKKLKKDNEEIETKIKKTKEEIAKLTGIRSKKWQKEISQCEQKLNESQEELKNGIKLQKDAEETASDLNDKIKEFQQSIKTLEDFSVALNEMLSKGYYRENLYVLSIKPEERRKLGRYEAYEKMSLYKIMEKLDRLQELYDLTDEQVAMDVQKIFLRTLNLKLPSRILESRKIISSSEENIAHLKDLPSNTHIVKDPLLKDEIVINAVAMVELEDTNDPNNSFELVTKCKKAIEHFGVPLNKGVSLRISDDENKSAEDFISAVKLQSSKGTIKKRKFFGEDAELCNW